MRSSAAALWRQAARPVLRPVASRNAPVPSLQQVPKDFSAASRSISQLARSTRSKQNVARDSQRQSTVVLVLHQKNAPSSRRGYSTAPNQQQVLQSFATPLTEFLIALSRIARILIASGLAIVGFFAITYEGTHQYVEYFAMPAAAAALQGKADEYGWSEELFLDGSWAKPGLTGTDPRLTFKIRHAIRSAWVGANWGGGFSPTLLIANAGQNQQNVEAARYQIKEAAQTGEASIDAGLSIAEKYLDLALFEAEKLGIGVPDVVALRQQPPNQVALDGTAVALESQLAHVRSRIGTPQAISQAIEGYERLYNAFTYTSAAAQGEQPRARTIALANKIAGLYTSLGRKEEAETWYTRAVSTIPTAESASKYVTQEDIQKSIRSASVVSSSPAITRAIVTSLLGLSVLYATPSEEAKQKARFQVDAAYKANLERALGTQIAALKILRLELQRLSSPLPGGEETAGKTPAPHASIAAASVQDSEPVAAALATGPAKRSLAGGDADKELYWLWLLQQDGQSSMLLAETIYALQLEKKSKEEALLGASAASGANALLNALKGAFGAAGKSGSARQAGSAPSSKYAQSIAWLQESEAAAEKVYGALVGPGGGKKQKNQQAPLSERWQKNPALELVAKRLLRDSRRMEQNAGEMIGLLERA